jgi:hypothetical protein
VGCLIRMRVLLPFGNTNQGSNSEANGENFSSGEGITSFVSSSSSRNNLQAFCRNCSERSGEAELAEVDSTQASSGSFDRDILNSVTLKSVEFSGSTGEEAGKVRIFFWESFR